MAVWPYVGDEDRVRESRRMVYQLNYAAIYLDNQKELQERIGGSGVPLSHTLG